MSLTKFDIMLAQASNPAAPAPAPTTTTTAPGASAATGTAASGGPPGIFSMVPIALMFVVLYLLLIRPQSKRNKELAKLVSTLKSGDKVVTSGGVVGVVVSVKDKTVTLRSADTKMEVLKTSVSEVIEPSGEPGESAKANESK